eukprot:m51a1_g6391 hypothetical protein (104) ;mRNA; f:202199-204717
MAEPLSFAAIRRSLERSIRREVLEEIFAYVNERDPHLWALNPPHDFIRKTVYLTIYKDRDNLGYKELHDRIVGWMPLDPKMISHNMIAAMKTSTSKHNSPGNT